MATQGSITTAPLPLGCGLTAYCHCFNLGGGWLVIYPLVGLANGEVNEEHKTDKRAQHPNNSTHNNERPNDNGSYGCNHFLDSSVGCG